VWDWDIETGKAWWSSSYYELLGYEPGEVEPSFGTFVDGLVYPDDRESIQQAINAHIEYNTPYILEIRLKTKGGEYKWFETSGSARRNINGKAIHMSGVIIDRHSKITLRKELERSEYLLNEESPFCMVPQKYRVLEKLMDTNDDEKVDEKEISSAIAILEKAKREEQKKKQKDLLLKSDFYKYDYDDNGL
jgi:PAS domain S-box-containing protein